MAYISNTTTNAFIRRCLDKSSTNYQTTMEQLASGNKYSSIAENPAAVSEAVKLDVQINFNNIIKSNVTTGVDLLSMTEDYQENIVDNIQRIRDLTMQALNNTYSEEDISYLTQEIQTRLDYINQISDSVNFNGIDLLNGTSPDVAIKIGPGVNDSLVIGDVLVDVHTDVLGIDLPANPMTYTDWQSYLGSIDDSLVTLTDSCAKIGSYSERLETISDKLDTKNIDLTNTKSVISDTDVAQSSADLVKYQILQQYSVNIFIQANQVHQLAYSLIGG